MIKMNLDHTHTHKKERNTRLHIKTFKHRSSLAPRILSRSVLMVFEIAIYHVSELMF